MKAATDTMKMLLAKAQQSNIFPPEVEWLAMKADESLFPYPKGLRHGSDVQRSVRLALTSEMLDKVIITYKELDSTDRLALKDFMTAPELTAERLEVMLEYHNRLFAIRRQREEEQRAEEVATFLPATSDTES